MTKISALFLGFLFVLLGENTSAQGWISGKVYDAQTNESLPGVLIFIHQNQGVTTQADGSFLLPSSSRKNQLVFRYLGYKTVQKSVELSKGDTVQLSVGLQPEVFEMDQVVVTAKRIEERMAELSVSMTVIKAEKVGQQHTTDAEALLAKSPGIDILDGQASIRGGSGFSYGAGSRVLALLDGLPVIAPDAGNIRWQYLPLDNISQIEIIKGASSVAYGSSALNGVINFRTEDPTSIPRTTAYVQAGIYDRPRNKNWKWWSSPIMTQAAGFTHLRKKGASDFSFGLNGLHDDGYRKYNDEQVARIFFKWKQYNKKVNGLQYGLSLHGGFTRKTDFVLWENASTGALVQDSSTISPLSGTFFTLDPYVVYVKNDAFRHELRIRLQQSVNSFEKNDQNNSRATSFYTSYQMWVRMLSWMDLNAGFSQYNSLIRSNFYGDHQSNTSGAFAQLEAHLVSKLKLVSGFRIEYNALDGKNAATTPLFRAGLNYQLKEYTFFRASFGQGYRYPSIAERHAATTLGAVKIFPNNFIQPETGWNTEIGLKQGVRLGFLTGQLDFAVFYMQNKNMIEYLFGIYANPGMESFSFGFRATNIEAARIYGAETEGVLTGKTGKVFHQLIGGATFTSPVEYNPYTGKNTSQFLKYRHKYSVKANWDATYLKATLGLGIVWQSKMLRIDDVFLNELTREGLLPGFYDYWQSGNRAHWLADVRFGYKITPQINLSLVIKNLTNTEYMGRPGDVQPQRSFSLRLAGSF
ncbi:MAG: TonB-dependent receptor [Bacteroidales bacterium]|nr:TonB-dependent receptor [Bacteroidales bacterium]